MNSKRSWNSINKWGRTTWTVEFSHSPRHSDIAQNFVNWPNLDFTVRCSNKFKVVFNTNIPVLATASVSSQFWLSTGFFVPWGIVNLFTICVDFITSGIEIVNFDFDLASVSSKHVPHIIKRCASKLNSIIAFCNKLSSKLRFVLLPSVETIPHMVHLMIQFVWETSCLICYPNRCNVTIFPIFIISYHDKLAKIIITT